jgi:PAS domain S-box-containing protein
MELLINLGDVYLYQNGFGQALQSYQDALKLSEETGSKRAACEISNKIGLIYLKQKKYAIALTSTLNGMALANELKLMDSQNNIHKQLSEIYAATNDYKNAYIHHTLYTVINDSVYNEKNVKKIAELEYTYKFEKEKQAIELEQQKKNAVLAAEERQQKIIIFSLIAGFILMSLFAVSVYRSYHIKNKNNIILTKQKHEIEELNEELMVINEELMTSNEELVITRNLVEERENLLIQITDNIPVFISLVDTDLQYVFANNGYSEIFNRQKSEIRGRNVKDILNGDSYERAYPHIMKTLEGQTVTYENILEQNGGRQRIIKTTYIPYYQHAEIKGLIVCSDDITERKKAEQALKESEAQKAELMAMEIERIGRELETNQKSVTAATLKLIQNSERDAQTIERLVEIENNTNATGKQKINTLISDYKRLSYNSNWDEFEILFEKIHSSFYENLNTQFPTLTANDRKICAFLKLNMSSKEIAQITFQSEEALKKARLRLRQKLEISREINLVTFLQNI